jgi:endo-1,4-beta-xylanase
MPTRRSFLLGGASLVVGLAGCGGSDPLDAIECAPAESEETLWQTALGRGIVYGSSAATWQLRDAAYRRLFARESVMLFTEDDLLWWRLRPRPGAELDFSYGDRIVDFAEEEGMLVLGAHLVWDQGFGEGWDLAALFDVERPVLFETIDRVASRYRGRVAAWIVVNEAIDEFGLRRDVPWYRTVGQDYIAESFRAAAEADPDAMLLLNDFGYETDTPFVTASDRRRVTLELLDALLEDDAPVHALGVQAHLHAGAFAGGFDADSYREFLGEVADRGLKILITELDVLDDGLPADPAARDTAVADAYRAYLEAALDEEAVGAVVTFGLSDRYTWLEEDFPRDDGVARRPLLYDERLRPKPAYEAVRSALAAAPRRELLWRPPRCSAD